MTDITAFPAIVDVLHNDGPTWTFTATEAITRGMVVGFAATGIADSVVCMDETASEIPIGVAITTAAAGAKVAVALNGSIVTVANADADTALEAGALVMCNDCAVKGTVSEYTPRAAHTSIAGATTTLFTDSIKHVVGTAIGAIAANSTGKVLLNIVTIPETDIAT